MVRPAGESDTSVSWRFLCLDAGIGIVISRQSSRSSCALSTTRNHWRVYWTIARIVGCSKTAETAFAVNVRDGTSSPFRTSVAKIPSKLTSTSKMRTKCGNALWEILHAAMRSSFRRSSLFQMDGRPMNLPGTEDTHSSMVTTWLRWILLYQNRYEAGTIPRNP